MNFIKWLKARYKGPKLKHVDQLKLFRREIRKVEHVDPMGGVGSTNSKHPCLARSMLQAGQIDASLAVKLQYPEDFAPYFGCTFEEAGTVIFGDFTEPRHKTGKDYAKAITTLLRRYGYV